MNLNKKKLNIEFLILTSEGEWFNNKRHGLGLFLKSRKTHKINIEYLKISFH